MKTGKWHGKFVDELVKLTTLELVKDQISTTQNGHRPVSLKILYIKFFRV